MYQLLYQASLIFENELEVKTGTKIPVGIHSKCEVTSVEKGDQGKGIYYDINFKDSEGRFNNKRLWAPKGSYPQDGQSPEEAKKAEEILNISHVLKLVHIFLGDAGIKAIPDLDYQEMMDTMVSKLTPEVLAKEKVNLKLIYDTDGQWSVFGKFPDYVEKFVEGQEPKIKYSSYEISNRCTAKPAAKPVTPGRNYDINQIL